ncbi:GAF and ANTAR domain-containing protein [Nocardioides sp.]|uniref:GAF and ANTAR domain-containing protein n=1 Tax=Nocardioides sp. TaxID=35761 RepID=UPI0037851B42
MTQERELAAQFAHVSGELLSESSEELTFEAVVKRAVSMVPGCVHAGITLRRRRGRAETVAATDQLVERLDTVQYALGAGPCLDAAFERENVVVVDDTGTDRRWPRWSDEARALGVASVMAVRLSTGEETLGALNLYSEKPDNFAGEAGVIASIFASHATEAMSKARLVTGLRAALESRHLIGIAQGVLAAQYDVSYERAFEVLHRYSNDRNLKLRDVARAVAETRRLPLDDLG